MNETVPTAGGTNLENGRLIVRVRFCDTFKPRRNVNAVAKRLRHRY